MSALDRVNHGVAPSTHTTAGSIWMRQVVLIVVISSRGKQFRQNRQIRQRVKRAGQEHIAKAE